ncbi:MAG: hypothetical protein J07HQX50_01622 [Haloquadratum sp. J07HQX50]|nr:MAG: hypothetical protein J07HQX50_01622 [Haloquadratum sp. J07HQX50]
MTIFVTGFSLGVGLIPVVVGIPILAGVIGLAGYVGLIEVELLNTLYGQDMSFTVADPRELSITTYLKAIVTTPRNYLLVLFAFGSFLIGLHVFVAIIVGFTLALTLAVAPLVYWMPGVKYELTQASGTVDVGSVGMNLGSITGVSINTLPEAVVASGLGIICCLVGLHAVNLTAWVFRTLTERLLRIGTTPERSDMSTQ